ncbi:MAG: LacI family DNA-binding transcriptional regulator [Chloroflexota bacterium]
MPTLEEIAKLAHVSRSTVSRVINDDPDVREATRRRVQRVIDELGFQPNRAARSLAGGRMRILGLVIPRGVARLFADPYFSVLIEGVTAACDVRDYSLMLWLIEANDEQRMTNQILHGGLVDGLLITSALPSDFMVQALEDDQVPYVLVGQHPKKECGYCVDIDNASSAREAVLHLLRLGHKRVAAIHGSDSTRVGLERRWGYLEALQLRGLTPLPVFQVEADFTEIGGYYAARRLLQVSPDAIFAASDAMAIGALRAIREAGLRVPEDVAVVGFDDMPFAAHADPPLTTIRQPIQHLGSLAAEMLIERIENPQMAPRRVILPTELVVRASCGMNLS